MKGGHITVAPFHPHLEKQVNFLFLEVSFQYRQWPEVTDLERRGVGRGEGQGVASGVFISRIGDRQPLGKLYPGTCKWFFSPVFAPRA